MKRKLVKNLVYLAPSTAALTLVAGCDFPEKEYEEDDRYSIVSEI
ncbi:hypothetical protein [Hydrococcus rivularis]|nr:hypothetical protein [Hydrococcus rivularis]